MSESNAIETGENADLIDAFVDTSQKELAVYRRNAAGEEMLAIGVCEKPEKQRRRIFWRAFDGWHRVDGDGRWSSFDRSFEFVPRIMALRQGDKARTEVVGSEAREFAALLDKRKKPPEDEVFVTDTKALDESSFVEGVRQVVDEGVVLKGVFARRLVVTTASPISPSVVLKRLADAYPSCTIFAISPGDSLFPVFVGATPERLVEIDNGVVKTMALAGTTRQEEGRSLREAEVALLKSAKDREEHRFVRDMIVDILNRYCRTVKAQKEPDILRLGELSHLHTAIRGELERELGILDVATELHPTPAVCGTPRKKALEVIREVEGFDRGLYAGVLGWTDPAGNGEADVLLRAGLIDNTQATMYAGAGITADSELAVEWRETDQKFQPLLEAITGGRP